ncbi:MAG: DAK2 domain-containing protein [Actinomycetota bacterium]|nr:DAK2 domain-containing protein [Actinomycetota bacterium]
MDDAEALTGDQLAGAMLVFRDQLRIHRDLLNRLNVYPVPDGDTGTNMTATLDAVVEELPHGAPLKEVAVAIARASLMGARGNSGIILSQLLRGFTDRLLTSPPDTACVAQAVRNAATTAVAAVQQPTDGTILTVAAAAATAAEQAVTDGRDLPGVLTAARCAAVQAVAVTPTQLPSLAQAGVVDAGGAGYSLMFDALLEAVTGASSPGLELPSDVLRSVAGSAPTRRSDQRPGGSQAAPRAAGESGAEPGDAAGAGGAVDATRQAGAGPVGSPVDSTVGSPESPRYEVMFLLDAPAESIGPFRAVWDGIGESIVVVGGGSLWNCHIHTDDIGAAIEAAIDCGKPRRIRVSDLAEQVQEERWVREAVLQDLPSSSEVLERRTAVVAVAEGAGLHRAFRSLGTAVVTGGGTVTPTVDELVRAVESLASPEVIILSNSSQVVSIAEQVASRATGQGRRVAVLATSDVQEGIAAACDYDPASSLEENLRTMGAAAGRVVSGRVTRAVRPADGPGCPIAEGDWIGLSPEGIEVVGCSLVEVTCALLAKLVAAGHELVTIVEGEGHRPADTRAVTEWLAEHHPSLEVEVVQGGQPIFPFLVGIE